MKRKRTLIMLHVPVWVIAIFIAWFFSADSFPGMRSSYVVFSALVLSFWMLGSFCLFYSYLVPEFATGERRRLFWLYVIIFVLILMPVVGIALLLLTRTSALTLPELLSSKGVLPFLGSVIITLVCSIGGTLYRLILKRYYTS